MATKIEKTTKKISETKNGAVIVLRIDECKKLGFKDTNTTKEVIKFVKEKLGIWKKEA